ncbi:MAG: sensor histidine kinase [Mycobacteriales bacterium]
MGEGRRVRDWLADALIFGYALGLGLLIVAISDGYDRQPAWIRAVDLPLGMLACLSLWWRRRYPLAVALAAVPSIAITSSAFGAGTVITFNLALRVPWRRALPVLGLAAVTSVLAVLIVPTTDWGRWGDAAFVLAYYLAFFSWGRAVRARRKLVLNLREEAERQRADEARRLADTRRAEREAIAREMHDALAHRISLVSVHAGALAYRIDQAEAGAGPRLGGDEVADSARIIHRTAHQALDDLHEILHVLRAGDAPAGPPRPPVADIRTLVGEARTAGQDVDLTDDLDGRDGLRPQALRTIYRVVQEGLTNARKHAPGAPVTVRLAGGPDTDLSVEISNPLPAGRPAGPPIPGAGTGLIGLRERVELDGGVLRHARAGGRFTLLARLPREVRR